MLLKIVACSMLAVTCPITAVGSNDPSPPMFSLGGFGTFGVVHSDQDKADFTAQPFEAAGAGHSRRWSAAVDSLFGLQASAHLASKLSAVLQIISQQNYDASFRPHVEWANLKYQFTPDLSIRVGRTALGLFLVTDSRHIGFTNPWVRPPSELYGLVSVTSNDGLDVSYRLQLGAVSNTIQTSIGQTRYKFPVPNSNEVGTANSKKQVSLVDSYDWGPVAMRLTYGQAHVTIAAFDPLFDAFRQFGPQGVGIADKYDVDDRIVSFFGFSASYEPGDWFAMAEWARVDTHSVLGTKTGWYTSAGYRCGAVTPYVTYAQVRADTNTSDPGLNLSGLPAALGGAAQSLNAQLNESLAAIASQSTVSLGARWDIKRTVDLKLQFDHTQLGRNSQGWLTNLQPGFQLGSSVDIISATIDFVF
jgi:porin-like protein